MNTVLHILNGDALLTRFQDTSLKGEIAIMRECLIVGDLTGDTLQTFYDTRSKYIFEKYGDAFYADKVVSQFDKILQHHDAYYLWFGYDLFCLINMCFVVSLIETKHINSKVYIVHPIYLNSEEKWQDFGNASVNLLHHCFEHKKLLSSAELLGLKNLWFAFKNENLSAIQELANSLKYFIPYVQEVSEAYQFKNNPKDKKGILEHQIESIIEKQAPTDFYSFFEIFSERHGVYGFGDAQVKPLYENLIC